MNLERGLRRITWVIFVPLFLLGVALVGTQGWNRLDSWNRAGEPVPEGEVAVYVTGEMLPEEVEAVARSSGTPSEFASFPGGTPEETIKETFDREVGRGWPPLELKGSSKKTTQQQGRRATRTLYHRPSGQEFTIPDDATDEQIKARILQHKIAFIYFRATVGSPSAVYSRKAILQAEAAGRLTREQQEILSRLRTEYHFPYPVSEPFSAWEWIAYMGAAAGIAAIPWGIFFLIRWIVRGFKSDPAPS